MRDESLCPGSPDYAAVFTGRDATKSLEQWREAVGCQDARKVRLETFAIVIIVELDGRACTSAILVCRPRHPAGARDHAAARADARLTRSDAESRAVRHRGSRRAAEAFGAGTPQQPPSWPQKTRWTGIWRVPSWDSCRVSGSVAPLLSAAPEPVAGGPSTCAHCIAVLTAFLVVALR